MDKEDGGCHSAQLQKGKNGNQTNDILGNVLTMFRRDFIIQWPVDVVQVSQHARRQLNNLLVPVRLGHFKQRRVEDRQNDGNVVTDKSRNVLVAPERQHSLRHLSTNGALI